MVRHSFVAAVFAGVALALLFLAWAERRRQTRKIVAVGLVVAALVYVALAIIARDPRALLVELSGLALFAVIAWLGVRRSPYFLAFGWAAHVAWDLLLHPITHSSYAPWWYAVLCVGFDLIVAGYVVGGSRRFD